MAKDERLEYMEFGEALYWAKKGFKIARKGWNGKGRWVSYTDERVLDLDVHKIWTEPIKQVAEANGGKVKIRSYFNLKTIDNEIQIGWIPSASDILAKDWYVV